MRLHSHYARLHEHYVRLHRITHGCTCIPAELLLMQPCGAATQGCIAAMWGKHKACLLMIFVFHSATNASSTGGLARHPVTYRLPPPCREANLPTNSPCEAAGCTLPCASHCGHEDDVRAISC